MKSAASLPSIRRCLVQLAYVCVMAARAAEAIELAGDDTDAVTASDDDQSPSTVASATRGRNADGTAQLMACLSCLSTPSMYSTMNFSALTSLLRRQGGLRLPAMTAECGDTPAIMTPQFGSADVHACANSERRPGACVKLKGYFQHEPFVLRGCWNTMWLRRRNLDKDIQNKCFYSGVNFTKTDNTIICFCTGDMCNGGTVNAPYGLISLGSLAVFLLRALAKLH